MTDPQRVWLVSLCYPGWINLNYRNHFNEAMSINGIPVNNEGNAEHFNKKGSQHICRFKPSTIKRCHRSQHCKCWFCFFNDFVFAALRDVQYSTGRGPQQRTSLDLFQARDWTAWAPETLSEQTVLIRSFCSPARR